MASSDFGWAVELTGREGWGFVRRDFARILEHTPQGSFVALRGGRRVGMLTTFCHGRTCWIGNVVVEGRLRGEGIGRELVRAALMFAAQSSRKRVALLSREKTTGFYGALGFRRGARYIGLSGMPGDAAPADPNVVGIDARLLSEVLVLDREGSGEERRRLLQKLARDFERHFLVYTEKGRALGFIVGKPGRDMVDVGPWMCVRGRPAAGEALFRALASGAKKRLEAYVPARNLCARRFLEGLGLKQAGRFIEMHRGPKGRPRSEMVEMLAVAGLEKG